MKLPATYPSILRTIAESGYVARSGNRARISLATDSYDNRRQGLIITWTAEPSEADKGEFEGILESAGSRTFRGLDLSEAAAEQVANDMANFVKRAVFREPWKK